MRLLHFVRNDMLFSTRQCSRAESYQSGFTLIESLIAMTLLAYGLVTILGMQVRLLDTNRAVQNRTTALLLANNKLEEIRYSIKTRTDPKDLTDKLCDTPHPGGNTLFSFRCHRQTDQRLRYALFTTSSHWEDGGISHHATVHSILSFTETTPSRLLDWQLLYSPAGNNIDLI